MKGVFSPPIPCTPPLHDWHETYAARKAELQGCTVTLRSGRVIAYFEEGDPEGRPVVAFHGGMTTKLQWMAALKEPLPGVRLIAVDRPGCGKSSAVSWKDSYKFEDSLSDMKEFVDALGLEKFVVIGHSNGTAFALGMAATWPERVCGCAVFSCFTDPYHARATADIAKKNGADMAGMYKGCCSCCFVGLFKSFMGPGDKSRPDKAFAGLATAEKKAAKFAEFSADPFLVCSFLDGWLEYDAKGVEGLLWEMLHCRAAKWPFDIAAIRCPTHIWSGQNDFAVPVILPQQTAKVVPNATLNMLEEHGHTTICAIFAEAIRAISQEAFPGD